MTAERTFDWRSRHDPRSRIYGVLAAVDTTRPRSYTWAMRAEPLDQGREGACFPAGTLVRLADGSHRPVSPRSTGPRRP